jgi:hypothetical protein
VPLDGLIVTPPLPNPPWVRWDHTDPGVWPAIGFLDSRDHSLAWQPEAALAGNAREEALLGTTTAGRDALRAQAAERLRRAGA